MRAYKQISLDSEPKFDKRTAFNKDFGVSTDSVPRGDDVRLSDARTPVSHAHLLDDVTGLPEALGDKVDVSGAIVDQLLSVHSATSFAQVAISAGTSGDATTQFSVNNGDLAGYLYASAATDSMILQKRSQGTAAATTLELTANNILVSKMLLGVEGSTDDALTTRGNLNSKIAELAGEYLKIADALLQYADIDHDHDTHYVGLDGDQNVAGKKVFTGIETRIAGNMIVEGDAYVSGEFNAVSSNDVNIGDRIITLNSELVGLPTLDAGFEIERGISANAQLLWDESAGRFAAGLEGNPLIPVVLDDDARFDSYLELAGGELSGDLTINKDNAFVTLESASGNPAFRLGSDTAIGAQLYYRVSLDDVILQQVSGNNTMVVGPLRTTFSKEVRGVDSTIATSFTTRGYVDGEFLSLDKGSTQILNDDITINTGDTSRITVNSAGTGQGHFRINHANKIAGLLYGDDAFLSVRKYIGDGSFTVDSEVKLGIGRVDVDVPLFAPSSTDENTVTTRGYVDDNKLDLAGGTLAGDLIFDQPSTVSTDIRFKRDGTQEALMASIGDRFVIQHTDNGQTSQLKLFNDRLDSSVPVYGVDSTNTASLTTKGYVDDNTNVVQQPPAYEMVMPTAAPTTGQQLEVDVVSGTVVQMKWV